MHIKIQTRIHTCIEQINIQSAANPVVVSEIFAKRMFFFVLRRTLYISLCKSISSFS